MSSQPSQPRSQRIVFNSSLPRSGSTLLQNILAQNPRFHCSATSGVMNLLLAGRAQFSTAPMFKAQDPDLMRAGFLGFCRRGLEGFYESITDKPVCVDKHRGWFHYYEWLSAFYPRPRIVVCIRDLRAVLSSMEKLFRKNRHLQDPADSEERMNMTTVTNRLTHWLNSNPVGLTVLRLMEAMQTGTIRHFHVVRFEDLTTDPAATLRKVYAYLEEPDFEHDCDHVRQTTREDDSQFVFYGDHTIREKVQPVRLDYNEVLGKDLAEMVKANNPAFYKAFFPEARDSHSRDRG
jgi:sulfotransferase